MPQPWPIPPTFNGEKFASRYGLTARDFYVENETLLLRAPATVPDDPPIFDVSDSPIIVARRTATASLNQSKEGQVTRALAAVMLGEINALRAAVVPPLPARTLQQLKNAIINRIDDGTAD